MYSKIILAIAAILALTACGSHHKKVVVQPCCDCPEHRDHPFNQGHHPHAHHDQDGEVHVPQANG